MGKSKLSNRITWHVILIMAIFDVLIILAVFKANLFLSRFESETRAQHIMEGIVGKLSKMMRVVEISASNNVAEIEENLDSPKKVFDALENELRLNSYYMGCSAAFEPYYFPSQGRWFEPYVKYEDHPGSNIVRSDNARVLRDQVGSPSHDYFEKDWYKKAMVSEKGKGHMTDPYYDDVGAKRVLISYVSPVFDRQGHPVCAYSIDIDLGRVINTVIEEETKIKKVELIEKLDSIDFDDDDDYIFIEVFDSEGKSITGTDTFDEKTLQTILKKDSIAFEEMEIDGITYGVSSKKIGSTGWSLVVAQHEHFVLLHGYVLGFTLLLIMTVGTIVIFFFMSRSIHRAIKPLHYLSDSAQKVANGNFDTKLPTFRRQDEITQLRDSFDTMQQSLKQYIEELKVSTAENASLESELNVAHSIQMSMVPRRFPKREGLDLYGEMTPAKEVGGDLYSYVLKGDQLYLCVGDVSGKGVPASLFMTQTTRLFLTYAKAGMLPADMAAQMNDDLSENNDRCMFVTMFIGLVDLSSGRLDFCSCGHNAPVIDGAFLQVAHRNKPLGLMEGLPFKGESIDDIRGRQILIYTDGLTEATNQDLKIFSEERMLQLMGTATSLSSQEVITMLTEAVDQFRDGAEPNDDLTLMCLKINHINNKIINDNEDNN